MGYLILALVTALLGYLIGMRQGKRRAGNDQALSDAWQKGYDSASHFWTTQQGQPAATTPADTGLQPPAQQLPPGQQRSYSPPPQPPTTVPYPATESSGELAPPTSTGVPVNAAASDPATGPAQPSVAGLPFMRHRVIEHVAGSASQQPAWEPPVKVKPELSPRARELRNINITLYVAALLLVAAGALFLSFALAPVAKLIGLCVVAVSFYLAGLLIHRLKPTLQPAAAAFAGTGLALLPLCAIATYNTVNISGVMTWLIFSLIATLAFGYATVRLRSRVLAWLAVLILISTAMSSGAAIQQGVFSYLIALLGCAVILQLLVVRSSAVRDSIFHQALATSYKLLPPLVFLASLVMFFDLSAREYFWTFLLLATHYLLRTRLEARRRGVNFAAARLLGMLAVVAAMNYLDFTAQVALLVLLVLLVVQAALVSLQATSYRRAFGVSYFWARAEKLILWGLALLFTVGLYGLQNEQGAETWWITLLVIPALMGVLILLWRGGGYLEPALLLAFAALSTLEMEQTWWRPLPALILAVLGLSLVAARATPPVARAAAQLRWILLLVIGAKLAQSLHVFTGGASHDLVLPTLVGIWAVTTAMLARNLRALRQPARTALARQHFLGRLIASLLVLLFLGALTRLYATPFERPGSFLGLGFEVFSILFLGTSVLLVICVGVLHERGAGHKPQGSVRLASVLGLLLFFGLALREDHWWLAPLVAVCNLGFFGYSLTRITQPSWRIGYAAVAQLHFTAATWWTVDYFRLDSHGQLSVLLLSLLLPQGIRLLARIRSNTVMSREIVLITISLLVLLPLILAVYARDLMWADRGTLLLGLTLWGSYGLLAHRALKDFSYRQWLGLPVVIGSLGLVMVPAARMNPATGWIRDSWWGQDTVLGLLLLLVLVAGGAEYLMRARASHRHLQLVALVVPWLLLLSQQPALGWVAGACFVAALAAGLLVHTRQLGWIAIVATLFLLVASYSGWRELAGGMPPRLYHSMDVSWALLAGAMLLLIAALLHGRFNDPEPGYSLSLHASPGAAGHAARFYYAGMLGAAMVSGANAHLGHRTSFAVLGGAVLLLAVALVIRFHELPAAWVPHGNDAVIVLGVLLSLNSYRVLVHPIAASTTLLILAVVAAGICLRHLRTRAQLARGWMLAAAILASTAEVASIADAGAVVQMLILLCFAGILAYGLLRSDRLLIWWAAIAITAAVLWFLRNYASLLLVLVAAGLIVLAVLKLLRVEKTPK